METWRRSCSQCIPSSGGIRCVLRASGRSRLGQEQPWEGARVCSSSRERSSLPEPPLSFVPQVPWSTCTCLFPSSPRRTKRSTPRRCCGPAKWAPSPTCGGTATTRRCVALEKHAWGLGAAHPRLAGAEGAGLGSWPWALSMCPPPAGPRFSACVCPFLSTAPLLLASAVLCAAVLPLGGHSFE